MWVLVWVSYPKLFDFEFGSWISYPHFWGLGVGMEPINKTQTQLFLAVNVWFIWTNKLEHDLKFLMQ